MNKQILNHVAFIPDGNRRWARSKGRPTVEGHRKGFASLEKVAKHIRKLGIHTFTVWAFSTENWNRDPSEVDSLMKLYELWLKNYLRVAKRDGVRIAPIGRRDRLPASLLATLEKVELETREYKQWTLGFALDYGGRDEIVRAIQRIQSEGVTSVTEAVVGAHLDTHDFEYPDADLVIRTSGENRTSGFMPWQNAYSEYIFHTKYLPDFTTADLDECVAEYNRRQRRFGH